MRALTISWPSAVKLLLPYTWFRHIVQLENYQLGAAVFVDYTKLETNLSSVKTKARSYTWRLNRSHVTLVWTAPPNVQRTCLVYGSSTRVRSKVFRTARTKSLVYRKRIGRSSSNMVHSLIFSDPVNTTIINFADSTKGSETLTIFRRCIPCSRTSLIAAALLEEFLCLHIDLFRKSRAAQRRWCELLWN